MKNGGFGDNPSYINETIRWAHEHPRVKAMVYFSVDMDTGDYRLSTYPASAEALAASVASIPKLRVAKYCRDQGNVTSPSAPTVAALPRDILAYKSASLHFSAALVSYTSIAGAAAEYSYRYLTE